MENNRSKPDDDGVADNATVVAKGIFSEYTLREIVSLTPSQQLELVKVLIKNAPKAKEEYRKQAQRYRARNALLEEVRRRYDASRAGRTSVAVWFCVRLPALTWVCTFRPVGRLDLQCGRLGWGLRCGLVCLRRHAVLLCVDVSVYLCGEDHPPPRCVCPGLYRGSARR